MRFRDGGVFLGLSVASCTLLFLACSSSDGATGGSADGGSAGSSGDNASSSGDNNGHPSFDAASGDDDSGLLPDSGPVDSGLVPVGDGGLGAGCNTDDECGTKVCSVGHTCVPSVSCRGSTGTTAGVDTCGAKDDTHDTCCASLTLPATKTRALDKYEITSGRIRAFINDVKAQNNGVANVRKFAHDYATAHPDSQLGKVLTDFPAAGGFSAYLDLLPDHDGAEGDLELPVWLGAFPADAMNEEDGCFVGPGLYGAATYWQDPSVLKVYGIGYGNDPNNPDGTRKFSQAVYDGKPQNCTPPILMAAFCAWDGGELALTSDYKAVYGNHKVTLPNADGNNGAAGSAGATVWLPWTAVLPQGHFNYRNGHIAACINGWPGCNNANADIFFQSPTNAAPEDDDAPEIAQPGRLAEDVTAATDGDGNGIGWYDIGGNLLEAAWPDTFVPAGVKGFCDTSAGPGAGATLCNRDQPAINDARPGTLRYSGNTPSVMLVGYSFEGHAAYGQNYFADDTATPGTAAYTTAVTPYMFPAQFQYGKVGGRCARVR